MRCEFCQGTGKVPGPSIRYAFKDGTVIESADFGGTYACEHCGGSGIGHCCDGLCEQPTNNPESNDERNG